MFIATFRLLRGIYEVIRGIFHCQCNTIWYYLCCSMALLYGETRGIRRHTALRDDFYDIVVEVMRGQFKKSKPERSTTERSAMRYYYRYKSRLSISNKAGKPDVLMIGNLLFIIRCCCYCFSFPWLVLHAWALMAHSRSIRAMDWIAQLSMLI